MRPGELVTPAGAIAGVPGGSTSPTTKAADGILRVTLASFPFQGFWRTKHGPAVSMQHPQGRWPTASAGLAGVWVSEDHAHKEAPLLGS